MSNISKNYLSKALLAKEKWSKLQGNPYIMLGSSTCGRASRSLEIRKALKEELDKNNLDIPLIEVGCLGHCYAEPLVIINNPNSGFPPLCYGYVNEGMAKRLIEDYLIGQDPCLEYLLAATKPNEFFLPSFKDFPRGALEKRIILKRCGLIDPKNIEHNLALEGYLAFSKVLEKDQDSCLDILAKSKLRGRGGAGFLTARKWKIAKEALEEEKYIICNADEGDPGAFMDRSILESDPHQVIEGIIIGAYLIGALKGYIYIRSEYPLAVEIIKKALADAKDWGFLGKNILGSTFSFDLEVFEGSGAFVCGEETALIASMQGDAGIPRCRPPHPAEKGLWNKPTVINNVKTFALVPEIFKKGASFFGSIGTKKSSGTVVFALAGKINNAGLIEVPMGEDLKQIIEVAGGGASKSFKAVQIGGPSGACLPISFLDTPADFESLQEKEVIMGSGGMVVLDEDDCMVEIARYFLEFTQKESCGKCTFCRLGTKQMLNILENITKGEGSMEDLDQLLDLAYSVKKGSLCNLGKSAPNPVLSTLKYFKDEYEAHIKEKRCPSLMCKALIDYYIVPQKCERSCDACVGSCPVEAISTNEERIKIINMDKCVKCNSCIDACPPQYKAIIKRSPIPLKEGE